MLDQVCGDAGPATQRGASAVEYALLVAGIAAVIVAIVLLLGGNVETLYSSANSGLQGD